MIDRNELENEGLAGRVLEPLGKVSNVDLNSSGGFGSRPGRGWWQMFAAGEVPQCSATAKTTGKRCRFPTAKGATVCRIHGGKGGRGRLATPTNQRNRQNQEVKRARLLARAEVARRLALGELREAQGALRTYAGKFYAPDEARILLAIDDWLSGRLTAESWRETRRALGLG